MNTGEQESQSNLLPQVSKSRSLVIATANVDVLQDVLFDRTPGIWYKKGVEACTIGDYSKAAHFFKKEISYNSSHWQSHLQLAFIYAYAVDIYSSFSHLIESMVKGYKYLHRYQVELDNYKWDIIRNFYSKNYEEIEPVDKFFINYALTYPILNNGINSNESLRYMEFCEQMDLTPKWLVYFFGGKAEFEEGNYNKAVIKLTSAIELKPDFVEAFFIRARAKFEINSIDDIVTSFDKEDVIHDFTKAIEIDASYADAYYNRALALSSFDKFNDAVLDYSKAIELDPKEEFTYLQRGCTYRKLGRYTEAINDYTWYLSIVLNNGVGGLIDNAYFHKGECYYELKDYDNAIKALSEIIEDDYVFTTSALELRAKCYRALGKLDLYESDLKRASFERQQISEWQNSQSDELPF